MNYARLNTSIFNQVMQAVGLINNIEIAPEIRRRNLEILFKTVGLKVYNKVYDMASWDMDVHHTIGDGIGERHYGLAKTVSDALVTGADINVLVDTYLDALTAKASADAFIKAQESAKVPTVNRIVAGHKPCSWCIGLAGTYEYPDGDVFRRHERCKCKIITSGYKSRNGLLENYVKEKKK